MLAVASTAICRRPAIEARRVRCGLAQRFRLVLSPRSPATLATEPTDCRHGFPIEADDSSPLAAGDSILVGGEFVSPASLVCDASAEIGDLSLAFGCHHGEAATLTRDAGVAAHAESI